MITTVKELIQKLSSLSPDETISVPDISNGGTRRDVGVFRTSEGILIDSYLNLNAVGISDEEIKAMTI